MKNFKFSTQELGGLGNTRYLNLLTDKELVAATPAMAM